MASLNDIVNSELKQRAQNMPDPRAKFFRNQEQDIHCLADLTAGDTEIEKKILMSRIEPNDGVHVHKWSYQKEDGKWEFIEVICWKEILGKDAQCPYCAGDHGKQLSRVWKYFGFPIFMFNMKYNQINPRTNQPDTFYGSQKILFATKANSPWGHLIQYANAHGTVQNCDFTINQIGQQQGEKVSWAYTCTPINFENTFELPELQVWTPDDMFKRLSEKLSFEATLKKADMQQATQQSRQNFLRRPGPGQRTNGQQSIEQHQTATAVVERTAPEIPGLDPSMVDYMENMSNRQARRPSRVQEEPVVDELGSLEDHSF